MDYCKHNIYHIIILQDRDKTVDVVSSQLNQYVDFSSIKSNKAK